MRQCHEWTTQAYTFGIHVRHEKGRGAQNFRGRGTVPLYFVLAGTLTIHIHIPEIILAFEDDGPLGRGMGAPGPKMIFSKLSNSEQF